MPATTEDKGVLIYRLFGFCEYIKGFDTWIISANGMTNKEMGYKFPGYPGIVNDYSEESNNYRIH
jgi:hypothetical protein